MRTVMAIVTLAVCLAVTPGALAQASVTIGLARVAINEPVQPGGHYALPALPVINSGAAPATYQVAFLSLDGQSELKPDPTWVATEPRRFQLDPGERRDVALTLDLPWLVETGSYAGLIQVGPVLDAEGTSLATAVAAGISFRVEHGNILVATLNNALDALRVRAPWLSWVLLGVLALLLAYPILGLLGIKLSIERRR